MPIIRPLAVIQNAELKTVDTSAKPLIQELTQVSTGNGAKIAEVEIGN